MNQHTPMYWVRVFSCTQCYLEQIVSKDQLPDKTQCQTPTLLPCTQGLPSAAFLLRVSLGLCSLCLDLVDWHWPDPQAGHERWDHFLLELLIYTFACIRVQRQAWSNLLTLVRRLCLFHLQCPWTNQHQSGTEIPRTKPRGSASARDIGKCCHFYIPWPTRAVVILEDVVNCVKELM